MFLRPFHAVEVDTHFRGIREGFRCNRPMLGYPEYVGCLRFGWVLCTMTRGIQDTRSDYAMKWLDVYLRSWLIEAWKEGRYREYDPDGSFLSEVMWTLNVKKRPIPLGYNQEGAVSDALLLLMQARVPEIVDTFYAYEVEPESIGNERLEGLMNLSGFLALFPDFRQAGEWRERTLAEMGGLFNGGLVYPDGAHRQLSSEAHRRMLARLYLYRERNLEYQVPLPAGFDAFLERMWESIFLSVRPDGRMPLNGDTSSDLRWDRPAPHFAGKPLEGLTPAMQYISSNGKEGEPPEEAPSHFFPWGGQLISRSGWDRDAHWSFFDVGPSGTARRPHLDRLHLSISAYGRDLLVDSGVGQCDSRSHNVILVEGADQAASPRYVNAPVPHSHYRVTKDFDYARGNVDGFEVKGEAKHTRALMYVRCGFWVLVDRVRSDRRRALSARWHFHPECMVIKADELRKADEQDADGDGTDLDIVGEGDTDMDTLIDDVLGGDVIAGDLKLDAAVGWQVGKGCLRIKQLASGSSTGWDTQIRSDGSYGDPDPRIGGEPRAAPPSMMRAVYTTNIKGDALFGWILVPSAGIPPEIEASMTTEGDVAEVRVEIGGETWALSIPFAGSSDPALARIR